MRAEEEKKGRGEMFTALSPLLQGSKHGEAVRVAEKLQISENNVRVKAHKLRTRFRAIVREEVAATLAEGESLETEMRHLVQVLAATKFFDAEKMTEKF